LGRLSSSLLLPRWKSEPSAMSFLKTRVSVQRVYLYASQNMEVAPWRRNILFALRMRNAMCSEL
jgi:hypothetical protein